MLNDTQLLREYTDEASQDAFRQLVLRHIHLVYSAALRLANGDVHLTEDIAQVVFTDLARKARRLPKGVVLAGWLYRHTCFVARTLIRRENRRRARERIAVEMSNLHENPQPLWEQVAPVLEQAMARLKERDRNAIVLRYFLKRDLRSVGLSLGISDDAAQKRIARALESLRRVLSDQGVASPAAALGVLIAECSVGAAPAQLAATVAASSLAGGVGAAGTSLYLLNLMTFTKVKTGIAALVAAGLITSIVVQRNRISVLTAANDQLREVVQKSEKALDERAKSPGEADELERLRAGQREVLRIRSEVAGLHRDNAELRRLLAEKHRLKGQRDDKQGTQEDDSEGDIQYLQSDSWADVGLSSPEGSVQTWLWAARAGDAQRWAEASGESSNTIARVGWQTEILEVKSARIKLPDSASTDGITVPVEYRLHSGAIEHGFFSLEHRDNEWLISSLSGFPIRVFATPAHQDGQAVTEDRP